MHTTAFWFNRSAHSAFCLWTVQSRCRLREVALDRITRAYLWLCYVTDGQGDSCQPGMLPKTQIVWSHIAGITASPREQRVAQSHCSCKLFYEPLLKVKGDTAGLRFDYISRHFFLFLKNLTDYMLPVSSIIIIVKALSSPFNINFRNCCGVSASSDNKRIRLRNKSQRGVLQRKDTLLVSYSVLWFHQAFRRYKWRVYLHGSSTLKRHATQWRINQGHFFTYVSKHCSPPKSGFDSCDACVCFMFHKGKLIKCHWQKCKLFGI